MVFIKYEHILYFPIYILFICLNWLLIPQNEINQLYDIIVGPNIEHSSILKNIGMILWVHMQYLPLHVV